MKKTLIISSICILCFVSSAFAVTRNGFNLTVIKDDNPVREISGQVAIQFNTEYKLRLKNNNLRRCSATVWIDGALVSELGNFIIDGDGLLDIERFLGESLTEGKRFKFVPLSHPDVDDPNRAENGIVKVEFRLERLQEIMPKNWDSKSLEFDIDGDMIAPLYDVELLTTDVSQVTFCSNTTTGATIPGSYSTQSFHKVTFEGGDEVVTIRLKMVGN